MKFKNKAKQKGFSLIELLIVVVIIGIVAAIAIPNLLASRRAANQGSAVSALRTTHSAQVTYHATDGNGSYGTYADLLAKGLIDIVLANSNTGTKSGYQFTIDKTDSVSGSLPKFAAKGEPNVTTGVAATGSRSFAVSTPGVIYSGEPTAGTFEIAGGDLSGTSVVLNN